MSKLWASLVGSLASLAATFLFVHAWVLSDYLIYPSSHRDIFPSRAQLPDYYKYTVGPYLQKKGLEAEPLTFQTQDDPSNSFRGSSVAAWLVRSSSHMAGTGISR